MLSFNAQKQSSHYKEQMNTANDKSKSMNQNRYQFLCIKLTQRMMEVVPGCQKGTNELQRTAETMQLKSSQNGAKYYLST